MEATSSIRLFDGSDRTSANLSDRLPELIRAAGFRDVVETQRLMTPFGTLVFTSAHA